MYSKTERDIEFTISKWKKAYQKFGDARYDPYDVPCSVLVSRYYIERYITSSTKLLLEAGCGTARSSLDISLNHGINVVCLDITTEALLIAKNLFKKNKASGFFVCGDMRSLPFRSCTFDFVFSDGSLEHFRETNMAINEFFRVLRDGGRVLLTVPQISISMLTLGQLRGNIPNIPVIRQILEFIHMRLLKGKLMKNGYELSFTASQMKRLLSIFSLVDVGLYETFHELRWLRSKTLKKLIWSLMRHRLFCPLIYGFGVKSRK
jgi:ubiquinone/menaquinone biosynthesis C-methylase UbiE